MTSVRCHCWRVISGFLLPAFLVSCIYSSQVDKDKFPTPDAYHRTKRGETKTEPLHPNWWRVFEDRTLEKLIAIAQRESLDIEKTVARINQAQAQLQFATGGFLPMIGIDANAGRQQRILSDQIRFTTNQFNISLAASYELNLGGKEFYTRDAAVYDLDAATLDLDAARISLTANVVEAYYLVVEQKAQLGLLDETIRNRADQLVVIEKRYFRGIASALDLYQARESLATAKDQRAEIIGRLKQAEHALAVLAGRFPGKLDHGTLSELPQRIVELPAGVPGQLLLQRPDLQAHYRRLLATDARVGEAIADHFPTIGLSGSIGENFDPTGFIWGVLAQLSAPLFQAGQVDANVKLREGILREQIADFKVTLIQAVKEVEDAIVAGAAARQRIRWLTERTEAAEGAVRMAMEQYSQGLVGYLNILTLERSLYAAQAQLIAARRGLISARVQLCRALGGGWQNPNERTTGSPTEEGV